MLVWLFKAILTGLLIGLGAPFWFDVAKRLARVRKAFGGEGSAEERLSGEDPGADATKRRALVERVVADAGADSGLEVAGVGPPDENVVRMQELLRGLGFLPPPASYDEPFPEHGKLGRATLAAIDRFLTSRGIVGPDREAAIDDPAGPNYIARVTGELERASA